MGSRSGSWGGQNAGTRGYIANAEVLTADATNHTTAALVDADEVMLHCRLNAVRVAIGAAPDATGVAYQFVLEPGERFHVKILRGVHKIAAARDGASNGQLVVTPVSA